jgi:hypothetical protein
MSFPSSQNYKMFAPGQEDKTPQAQCVFYSFQLWNYCTETQMKMDALDAKTD